MEYIVWWIYIFESQNGQLAKNIYIAIIGTTVATEFVISYASGKPITTDKLG